MVWAGAMPSLLTVRDVAARLSLSPWTVRAWLRSGRIKSTRLGRRFRVEPRDLATFVEQSEDRL
ncbi:DNA binding domain-containing protein, excisionase family [Deinococcus reticulitermitis]|uniref:DNA binding domain-containing protein, excisionase family n=2 Tax=Deinococcus reticulitermitis TaxID=856736 RepID=A0A1H7CY77_9DEIO|nr:DNA binding domain-containing protein, excisionase family [Deinococcus reticulitermitis]